jgi:hypothetical protein
VLQQVLLAVNYWVSWEAQESVRWLAAQLRLCGGDVAMM